MILPDNILSKMSPEDRAALGKAGVTKAEAEARFVAKSERDLQRLMSLELNRRGIWYHQAAMHRATTGTVGTPDFLFSLHGVPCAVEVKFGNGKLRPEQARAIEQMQSNGWRVAVVRSFDEFRQFLDALKTQ